MPLDHDPRASYVLVRRESAQPGDWRVDLRRIPYDVEAAIAAYDGGLREVDPGFVAIMSRQLRAAHDYYGPWLRLSRSLPDAELAEAMQRYLAGLE